jgi:hypothetical protein
MYNFDNYYDFKNCIFYQMGHNLLECLKNDKGIAVFNILKYHNISTNLITYI